MACKICNDSGIRHIATISLENMAAPVIAPCSHIIDKPKAPKTEVKPVNAIPYLRLVPRN